MSDELKKIEQLEQRVKQLEERGQQSLDQIRPYDLSGGGFAGLHRMAREKQEKCRHKGLCRCWD